MSALPPTADIRLSEWDVRKVPRTCTTLFEIAGTYQPSRSAQGRWRDSALLLHRHCDVAVRREANLVAFHVGPGKVAKFREMDGSPLIQIDHYGEA